MRARSAVPLSLTDGKKGPTDDQTLATSFEKLVDDSALDLATVNATNNSSGKPKLAASYNSTAPSPV